MIPLLVARLVTDVNDFLIPDKKWSDKTGKVFDLEEPDA